MSRRKASFKRDIIPDPLYKSVELAKFINIIMRNGKKSIAERIVYNALAVVLQRFESRTESRSKKEDKAELSAITTKLVGATSKTFLEKTLGMLDKALEQISPVVELKSRRVGGATYQIPIEVNAERGRALARRWLVRAASNRNEKTMELRLAAEIADAFDNKGAAIKMRDDTHRMAKANQAFAHFRW
jgi:small subunit ribosomal protein S7